MASAGRDRMRSAAAREREMVETFPLPADFGSHSMIDLYESTRRRWYTNVFLAARTLTDDGGQPRTRRDYRSTRRLGWASAEALWVGEQWGPRLRRPGDATDKAVFVKPLLPSPVKRLLRVGGWDAVARLVPPSLCETADQMDVLLWVDAQRRASVQAFAYAVQWGQRAGSVKRAGLVVQGAEVELRAFRAPLSSPEIANDDGSAAGGELCDPGRGRAGVGEGETAAGGLE